MQAKEANPLISAAEERVIQAQGALQEAGAKMGPKFGVGVAGIWPRDRIIPIDGLPLGFGNVYVAAAGFVQTIYAGGSLIASKEAAQLAIDTAKAEKERISQTVANSVSIAYYNWRRACAKKAVAEEALKLAKDHLGRAEKLFVSGVVARGDVLRSKVAVADAELALIRSDNAVDLSLTALERAVGSRPEVTETADAATGYVPSPEALSDRESNIKAAYENRLEIKMYDLMSRRANKIAKAAEGRLLPQIMAAGDVNAVILPRHEEAVLSHRNMDIRQQRGLGRQSRPGLGTGIPSSQDDMKNTIKWKHKRRTDLRSSKQARGRAGQTESEEDLGSLSSTRSRSGPTLKCSMLGLPLRKAGLKRWMLITTSSSLRQTSAVRWANDGPGGTPGMRLNEKN